MANKAMCCITVALLNLSSSPAYWCYIIYCLHNRGDGEVKISTTIKKIDFIFDSNAVCTISCVLPELVYGI